MKKLAPGMQIFIALDQQKLSHSVRSVMFGLGSLATFVFETLLAIGCQLTAYGHVRSLADQNCFGSARDIVAVKLQTQTTRRSHNLVSFLKRKG
jgi:hypothetical protein